MARFALAVAVALTALLTFATVASGTHSNGNGPNKDLVAGTGTQADGTMIHVNAKNDNSYDDEAVHGHFYIRDELDGTTVTLQGEVVCLDVTGPFAAMVGRVTKAKPSSIGNTFIEIEVLDGGEPPYDAADWQAFQIDCEFNFNVAPIVRGNYIVHDQVPFLFIQSLLPTIAEFEEAAGPH